MRGSTPWAWCSFAVAGLWHRRGIAVMVLVTTLLAAGAADAAFIYRDAAATSGLRARLTAAAPQDSGVVVLGAGTPRYDPLGTLNPAVPRLPFASDRILGESIAGYVDEPGRVDQPVDLLTSTGLCGEVHVVAGRCPAGGDDVAVPAGVAAKLGWRLGAGLTVGQLTREPNGAIDTDVFGNTIRQSSAPPPEVLPTVSVRLVGTYDVTNPKDAYWMGAPPVTTASPGQATPSTMLASASLFERMPHFTVAQAFVAQPLRSDAVTTAEVPALRHSLDAMAAIDPAAQLSLSTQLPQLLDADAADRSALANVTLVSAAQLLALLGLVLVVVLAVSSAARRTETMAAGLQGRHVLRVAGEIAIEPIVLVAAGCAGGLVIAPAVVRLAVAHWLRAGTPVPTLPRTGAIGVLAVAAGGVLASAVIAVRAARQPPAGQSFAESRTSAAWWETAVFTLAVGGFVELLTAGGIRSHTTPWALLSPTICGLAVALLLARGLPPLLGPLVTRTRRTRRLSIYLLVRELRRDVVAWRVTAVVATAVSLLAFAVAIDRGAVVDRRDRAGLIVGANRVVSVDVPSVQALPGIVDRLDPDGQWAMAAVQITPFGSADEETVAVDSTRLAAVAGWSRPLAAMTAAELAKVLHPTPVAPYRFITSALTLPIANAVTVRAPVSLRLTVVLPSGARRTILGPTLRRGRHPYGWPTPRCDVDGGCRILAIGVIHPPRQLDLTIGGLGAGPWTGNNANATYDAQGWHLRAGHYRAIFGAETLIRPEYPRPLPIVTASQLPVFVGLDSAQPSVHVMARAAALPRLTSGGGSMVDLSYLQLAKTASDLGTTQVQPEVWLGTRAPPDAIARLNAMRVRVVAVDSRARQDAALASLDPALGLDAYLAVAALAVLLALALLCGQGAVAARRRRTEFVALATAGVSRFSLGCGWFAAAVVRLAFSVGAGSATGLFIARLAAPGVPLAAPATLPAPILAVQVWPAVIAAVATLLPLLIAEAFSVRWSIRTVGLRHTRESAA